METESLVYFKRVARYSAAYDDVPTGRSGHSMVADDTSLYIFGGYSQPNDKYGVTEHSVFPELWRFNFAQREWTKIEVKNSQTACLSSCMLLRERKLFVFGGTGYPFASEKDNVLKVVTLPRFTFDKGAKGDAENCEKTTKYKWSVIETSPTPEDEDYEMSVPPPDYGQSMIFHNNYVYVFAGTIGFYSLDAIAKLYRLSLDADTLRWEKLRPTGTPPCGRYKQEVIQNSEYFCILGGGKLHHSEGLDTVFRYSFSQNHWSTVATLPDHKYGLPISRLSFGCSKDGDNVYITGGRHVTEEFQSVSLKDVWHLRLSTFQWTRLFDLPENIFFHRTVMAPSGSMYLFGGVLEDGYRTDLLYKFRVPFSLGKLTELCWDKVCDLLNDNDKFSRDVLVSLGIPWNLIERAAPTPA